MDHASSMHLEGGSRPSLKFQNHAVGNGGRAGKSTKFQCQLQRRPRDPWPSQAIIQETEVGERERRGRRWNRHYILAPFPTAWFW